MMPASQAEHGYGQWPGFDDDVAIEAGIAVQALELVSTDEFADYARRLAETTAPELDGYRTELRSVMQSISSGVVGGTLESLCAVPSAGELGEKMRQSTRGVGYHLPDPMLRELYRLISVRLDAAEIAEAVADLPQPKRLQLAERLLAGVNKQTAPRSSAQHRAAARAAAKASILDTLETIPAGEAGRILAPRAKEARSIVQRKRQDGSLIGLPVGDRPNYYYPLFQFDQPRHRIKPLAAYANKKLLADTDPYGAASWWLTPSTEVLEGHTPLEELDAGTLTDIAVDNIIDPRGM